MVSRRMAIIKEIHCEGGGTVLINDACVAKTEAERARINAEISRAVYNCVLEGVRVRGVEEVKRIIKETAVKYNL